MVDTVLERDGKYRGFGRARAPAPALFYRTDTPLQAQLLNGTGNVVVSGNDSRSNSSANSSGGSVRVNRTPFVGMSALVGAVDVRTPSQLPHYSPQLLRASAAEGQQNGRVWLCGLAKGMKISWLG